MMHINLQNVEQLIFTDKSLRLLLSDFQQFFDSWKVAQMVPSLRNLGKRSVLDFMNALQPQHVEILESYFGDIVVIDNLDYHIVKDIISDLDDAEMTLSDFDGFVDVAAYRDENSIYICIWR